MIEQPPIFTPKDLAKVFFDKSTDEILTALIDKINEEYEYWDTVKYKKRPESCSSAQELWTRVKASRIKSTINTWDKYNISFALTNRMQRMCHEFDMNFGGSWGNSTVLSNENNLISQEDAESYQYDIDFAGNCGFAGSGRDSCLWADAEA